MHRFLRPIVALMAALSALSGMAGSSQASNAGTPPQNWQSAIDAVVLPDIARVIGAPIVHYTVLAQNTRYAGLEQSGIDKLDKQWRGERKKPARPLISAVLSNPTSSYLTRIQAQAIGLYTEIFVMDNKGLNVGQSNISSDFWQGDEAKWQKTFVAGSGSVFIDEPEFRDDIGVWVVQVNVSVDKDSAAIGAATFEVNLTELARRHARTAG